MKKTSPYKSIICKLNVYTTTQIAQMSGISIKTLYLWKRKYKDIDLNLTHKQLIEEIKKIDNLHTRITYKHL